MSFINSLSVLKLLSNVQNATSTSFSDVAVVSYLANVFLIKMIAIIIIATYRFFKEDINQKIVTIKEKKQES